MKKTILFGALAILSSALFMACKKNQTLVEEPKAQPKEVVITESSIFLLNGKIPMTFAEYQKRKAQKIKTDTDDDTESIIIDYKDENVIFENDSELREWALEKDSTGQIIALLDKKDSLIGYATQRGIIDDSLATLAYTDSLAAAEAATNAPTPIVTALYDGYNYTGTQYWLWLVSIRPTLGAFNGRASSLADWFLLPKVNFLASRTWFRGSKYFYWSFKQIPNLASVGFDNKAKSKL